MGRVDYKFEWIEVQNLPRRAMNNHMELLSWMNDNLYHIIIVKESKRKATRAKPVQSSRLITYNVWKELFSKSTRDLTIRISITFEFARLSAQCRTFPEDIIGPRPHIYYVAWSRNTYSRWRKRKVVIFSWEGERLTVLQSILCQSPCRNRIY